MDSHVTLETVTLPVQTVITEIELIVNDRPLTYVSEPLTSAHLLNGRRMASLPHNNAAFPGGLTSNKTDTVRAHWLALTNNNIRGTGLAWIHQRDLYMY